MALRDELSKLEDLRQRGALTDEEFARAKARLLNEPCGLAKVGISSALYKEVPQQAALASGRWLALR